MAMKLTNIAKSLLAAGGVAAALAVFPMAGTQVGLNAGTAQAAEEQQKPQRETRKTPALRNKVYEKLQEIQVLAEAQDYKGAKVKLEEMRNTEGKNALNSYELANMWNLYAFVYYSEENYPMAIKAYENLVAQPDIPEQLEINTKYSIAQLYFVTENYPKAVKMLVEWMSYTPNPNPDAHVLLAQGYYQTKDYKKAIEQVEIAFRKNEEKGKEVKEQWLLLARVLYYETGAIDKMVGVLETLVKMYPKREYWVQLSAMYGEQKKDLLQMVTMETAYVQNLLSAEGEIMNMAYLYLANDVPYKAAKVLDKALKAEQIKPTAKTMELLGNAYRAAQEVKKAIPNLEKAAELSKSGEPYSRLASVYLDTERFADAERAASTAIKKGDLRREDDTYIVLGMAQFYQDRLSDAKKSFREAAKTKKSERAANQWIKYINSEAERRAKLAED